MKINIVEHVDFRHVEAFANDRRIALQLSDIYMHPLSRSIVRNLTPEDARRLAQVLITAANDVDAVRISL